MIENNNEIQGLRDWSAEKVMGYRKDSNIGGQSDGWFVPLSDSKFKLIKFKDWHPDTDLNQAFMVAKRMRELMWYLDLFTGDDDFHAVFFKEIGGGAAIEKEARNIDPALAILKAARATEVK